MDNQHQKIKGYRELSQDEIDLMNKVKSTGEVLNELIIELRSIIDDNEANKFIDSAEMDLKVGVMKLVRSIAKPESF